MLSTEDQTTESPSTFTRRMRQLGWEEGRNISFLTVYAQRDLTRLESLAESLVKAQVEVILVTASPSVRAAQRVTKTIPIVFTPLSNVVGNGYVASLARPGGNVTGIASQFEEVLAKLVEFLHAIVPTARRIAVLVNEDNLSHGAFWTAAQGACSAMDLIAYRVVASSLPQFGAAVDEMTRLRAQAVLVSNDFLFLGQRAKLHELLQAARLPAAYGFPEHVAAGGLLSYGSSFVAGFEQAATYVDRILRGARPADLPVEQPTKFELVLNLKTASALGLTIPQTVLLRADEIVR
jgi:putative tryptophan/tyrosine transport system substrate-binding protein